MAHVRSLGSEMAKIKVLRGCSGHYLKVQGGVRAFFPTILFQNVFFLLDRFKVEVTFLVLILVIS